MNKLNPDPCSKCITYVICKNRLKQYAKEKCYTYNFQDNMLFSAFLHCLSVHCSIVDDVFAGKPIRHVTKYVKRVFIKNEQFKTKAHDFME